MPDATNAHPHQEQAERLFHQGCVHLQAQDYAAAEACFEQALVLQPQMGEALANLAFLRERQGALEQATALYRQALAAGTDAFELHMNLGNLLLAQKCFDEAEQCYAEALARSPESSVAWSNLAVLYVGCKREPDALLCLQRALACDPSNAKARFNLAYLYLRQGQFEAGWQALEARDWYANFAAHFGFSRWAGEPLQGKSLLIACEAGHGDVIQFARYVPLVKAHGAARVGLVCHPALTELMHTLDGIDAVFDLSTDVPRSGWDYWTPLMSVAYHLKTRADSIPAHIPYLHPQAQRVAHWAALLPDTGTRIGLVWKGNPKFENDADRSLASVQLLAPLWQVPGARFVSLQKGEGEDEVALCQTVQPMLELGPRMDSFADAAAIVQSLDLVICVDTAMAHLAGALGTPCWVLLPDYMTDWRWRSAGHTSAWYPQQMRLFRQGANARWDEVVEAVVAALKDFVAQRAATPPRR